MKPIVTVIRIFIRTEFVILSGDEIIRLVCSSQIKMDQTKTEPKDYGKIFRLCRRISDYILIYVNLSD